MAKQKRDESMFTREDWFYFIITAIIAISVSLFLVFIFSHAKPNRGINWTPHPLHPNEIQINCDALERLMRSSSAKKPLVKVIIEDGDKEVSISLHAMFDIEHNHCKDN